MSLYSLDAYFSLDCLISVSQRLLLIALLKTMSFLNSFVFSWGFPGGAVVKNLPVNAEHGFVSWEDPLEKEMAIHVSILT